MLDPLSARAPLAVLVLVVGLTGVGATVSPHRIELEWSGLRPELAMSADLATGGSIVETSYGILITVRGNCSTVYIEGRTGFGGTFDAVDVRGVDHYVRCRPRFNLKSLKYE